MDVLLNNAARGPENKFLLTKEGEELTFAANHTGHYALTMHLMPLMVAAPTSRIVNIASGNLTKACKGEARGLCGMEGDCGVALCGR